jgi:hypothetical protein
MNVLLKYIFRFRELCANAQNISVSADASRLADEDTVLLTGMETDLGVAFNMAPQVRALMTSFLHRPTAFEIQIV